MRTDRPVPAPPEETPEQAPAPQPERRPRRRSITPVFHSAGGRIGRPVKKGILMAGLLALIGTTAQAQTVPGTPSPATPAPVTQNTPAQGWTFFDDRTGGELQLPQAQLQRLMEMDARYHPDYSALGDRPWTNNGYEELTTRRNAEIRSILTPAEYDRWSERYNTLPPPPSPPGDTPRR